MNIPTRIGERYTCFIVVREDGGYNWCGRSRPIVFECEVCNQRVRGSWPYELKRMADHHEHGHAPCDRCGQMLLRRMDGSPRQHAHHLCPAKNGGDKIEREFIKNMTTREYA